MTYFLYVLLFSNGKRYFGLSHQPEKRWREHLRVAARGINHLPVYEALRKFEGVVKFKVMCAGDCAYIKALEIKAIAAYGSTVDKRGYNLSLGGDLSPTKSPLVLAKMSQSIKTLYESNPLYKARVLAAAKLGREQSPSFHLPRGKTVHTEASRAAISLALTGKRLSNETIAKRTASRFRRRNELGAIPRIHPAYNVCAGSLAGLC